MPEPAVVIAQCFNEEYLLPWWLKHHYPLFDHGVIIDSHSTDRSTEIVRELAPGWEVVPRQSDVFSAETIDLEVMEVERRFEGWKLSINITEFFCCRDFEMFRAFLEMDGRGMFGIRGVVLVDPPDTYAEPDPVRPLVAQRHHGFFEDERMGPQTVMMRSRFFHRFPDGAYTFGRHNSGHPHVWHPPGALILWCGYSPWNEQFLARKLQIKGQLSDEDKKIGWGSQHMLEREELEEMRLRYAKISEDLSLRPEHQRIFSAWPFENQIQDSQVNEQAGVAAN
ncbi:MAG: glycosyltransferase family 2 protein [Fimbriimonadaceae bacterium]|nr:glycosyltransferase family 2 protein [Fimbriimonadaceae bacterium]